MKINYEMTDTFGGEANYCWVKRGFVDLPDNASDKRIIHAVKKALGLTGVKCDYVGFDRWNVRGACVCFFID